MPRLLAPAPACHGNPAARLLRLLETLARGPRDFSMALLDGRVKVRVEPCSAGRILELIPTRVQCACWTKWFPGRMTLSPAAPNHILPRTTRCAVTGSHAVCGIEYGLQAAALHGALVASVAAGRLSGGDPHGRDHGSRLDDPTLAFLEVTAELQLREASGLIYCFALHSAAGHRF